MKRFFSDMNPTLRGLLLIALVAAVVVVLSLEEVLATVGGLLRIAFFLAIAFFLFLLWRERRGDLETWAEWNRRLFYAAIGLAVLAVGMAIGLGLPDSRDLLVLILALAACAYVLVRVWRLEHRA